MVPQQVLAAFGASDVPTRLPGGQGESWRSGGAVFKRAGQSSEAEWAATVLSTLDGPGFRVPKALAAGDGRWVVDRWVASQFVEGEHAGPNGGRWAETIAACEAFHAALAGVPRPAFLAERGDAWALADRMAWDELPLEVLPPFAETVGVLAPLLTPLDLPSQLIHGDFTANVLFADGQPPCVIDFSPYWRPAGFAIGVIVADALTWGGADDSILSLTSTISEFPQLLVRAELRRILELDQHTRHGRDRAGQITHHWQTVRLIEAHVEGLPVSREPLAGR